MTDSDAKEWVTVKLPKEIRNDAREDSRTYGEIMRDGLDMTDNPPEVKEYVEADHTVELGDLQDAFGIPNEVIPDDLDDRLDRIESATKEATNAAQSADRKLEELR